MGGKKKGKKGKGKKGKKGAFGEELKGPEMNAVLYAQLQSLNQKMIIVTKKAEESCAAANEKRAHDYQMNSFEKEKKDNVHSIMSDLTRQFKSTKEELDASRTIRVETINSLLGFNSKLEEEKKDLNENYERLEKTKTEKIKKMKVEYEKLKKDFDIITKETNDKMTERI